MRRILAIMLIGLLVLSTVPLLVSNPVKADPLPPPVITGVEPAEPWRSVGTRLPFSILGSDFVSAPDPPGLIVRLKAPAPDGRVYEIPRVGNDFIGVTPDRINVQAGFYVEGTWEVWVTNPDGQKSGVFDFQVKDDKPTAAIDLELLKLIDEYVNKNEYWRNNWKFSRDQYKAWIATLVWSEGGAGGYSAHSQAKLGTDVFDHRKAGTAFRFSTGIGPFQIDRIHKPGWTPAIDARTMPTIDKLDYATALRIVLQYHYNTTVLRNSSWLKHFNSYSHHEWYGAKRTDWPVLWKAVTGTDWNAHKDKNTSLDWDRISEQLVFNAKSADYRYENNVKQVGTMTWNISEVIKRSGEEDKEVKFVGPQPTWLITARRSGGTELCTYYYTLSRAEGIEVWVWNNSGEPENRFKYVFFRDFKRGVDSVYPEDKDGGVAGRTLSSQALDTGSVPERSIDVFMLVDLSGSFSDDLPYFKAQAPDLMATLKSSYPDIRFGLGKYEDYPIWPFGSASYGDKAYEQLIDLTYDTDAVLGIIAGLYTRSGADWPQSQLVALYQAATGAGQDLSGVGYPGASIPEDQQATFRDKAIKLFMLWTDAPFHRPGDSGSIPYPGPSFDETVEAILALDPPMVIGISSGGGGLADLRAIAAATNAVAPPGGVDTNGDGVIDIPEGEPLVASIGHSGQGIAAAIEGLVGAAVVLPIPSAGGPYTGKVGETIVFDGSGSFDPDGWIVLYEWDFESDGVFDFSWAGPAAEYAYTAEFSGVVTLRVTDNDGNTAMGTAPVEILPLEATVTIDPETLNLRKGGRWITAYIELPEEYAVEDIDIGTVQLLSTDNELDAHWGHVQNGVFMVKFDWATVVGWFDGLHDEEVELTVVGEFNGIRFEGTDTIRVIDPPPPGEESDG